MHGAARVRERILMVWGEQGRHPLGSDSIQILVSTEGTGVNWVERRERVFQAEGTACAKVQGQEGHSMLEPRVPPLGGVFYVVNFTFNCRPERKVAKCTGCWVRVQMVLLSY